MRESVRESGPAVLAGVASFVLLLAHIDVPVVTWDEGATIRRELLVRAWFERLVAPPASTSRTQLFTGPILDEFWPFAREEPDGHPPFYALVGLAGWLVSRAWLEPFESHRFGPVVLFSVTVAVMFRFVDRRFGRLAAVMSAGTWLLMPRVFVHARLASYDAPLACLWFLCVVSFWKAHERAACTGRRAMGWSAAFAGLLAVAAATKFTGWLIPLPLGVWSVAIAIGAWRLRDRTIAAGIVVLICFSLPWLATLPRVLTFTRQLDAVESAAVSPAGAVDSRQRAARAAAAVRASESGWLPLWGVLVPPALWAGAVVGRRRIATAFGRGAILCNWIAAAALTPAVTMLLIPSWWSDPIRGLAIFLWSNLTRQRTTWIPTEFLHQVYEFGLPWYNSVVWVALTVPPLALILCVLGIVATAMGAVRWAAESLPERLRAPAPGIGDASPPVPSPVAGSSPMALGWLIVLNAATLLVVRALPNAPGHDGERQLLGSFPFLAVLAGLGAASLRGVLGRMMRGAAAAWIARGFVAASLAASLLAIWHYRSAPLSYYTEFIGGVRGAERLGLEPTYYWDALDRRAIGWLNERTRPGEAVLFCNDFLGLQYLRRWGTLQAAQWPYQPGVPRWYVLQNRPGLFTEKPWDRWLAEQGRAEYVHAVDGVALLWIFSYAEYARAIEETRRQPSGS